MGAPPGAIGEGLTLRGFGVGRRRSVAATGNLADAPDATPRAAVIGLPMMAGNNGTIRGGQQQQQQQQGAMEHQQHATIRAWPITLESPPTGTSSRYTYRAYHYHHHLSYRNNNPHNIPNMYI
jgi:hypothetical protein